MADETFLTGKTIADAIREDEELLRHRFVHHMRPRRPLSMEEAIELCERMKTPHA